MMEDLGWGIEGLDALVWALLIVFFIDMQTQFSSSPRPWPLWVISFFTVVALYYHLVYGGLRTASVLHCGVLATLSTLMWSIELPHVLLELPLPYHLLCSMVVPLLFPSARAAMAAWMTVGSLDWEVVLWSALLSAATVLALWVWSVYVAKGQFGPFEAYLGWLTYPLVPVFAVLNAVAEEVEYRGVIMAALFGDTSRYAGSWETIFQLWPMCMILLQATLFAMEHYHAGFPSGMVGFGMVLIWGSLLGILRLFTDGMLLAVLVHVVADAAIGVILVANKNTRKKPRKRRKNK